MKLESRLKNIVSYTIDDFHSFLRSTKEDKETMIHWLTADLIKIENIDDFTVIEISLLILKKLNSLDLVNLEFIIETIADTLKSSENEIIHIAIPKVL